MFTGIVEEAGRVDRIQPGPSSIELTIRSRHCGKGLKRGDSMAVNGCCLTAIGLVRRSRYQRIRFDLLRETWDRTNFKELSPGSLINLERSLRANERLGGHFVLGHIDDVGIIRRWESVGKDYVLEIAAPAAIMKYVIHKGSIAVDGISLTVAEVKRRSFVIWIIPHTLKVTALKERSVGDAVNLEVDMLGKYVEQFVRLARAPSKSVPIAT